MVNKRFWLGILVMVLVFGMAVVKVEAQSNIEGIWKFSDSGMISISKFEKGKWLSFTSEGVYEEMMTYTIRGNTLIVDGDVELKFSIKENTLALTINGKTITGTKITESQSPIGRWVPERIEGTPRGFPDNLELTNDGTGIGGGKGLKWKVENSRITFDFGVWGANAYYYIIYDSKLILTSKDDYRKYIKER